MNTSEVVGFPLMLSVVGIAIVFMVQTLITVTVSLMRRLDERWMAKDEARKEKQLLRPASIDMTTLVLISAAVATMIEGRHRIRSVRRLLPADAPSSPWSFQGRAVLQGSHVVVRKPPPPS